MLDSHYVDQFDFQHKAMQNIKDKNEIAQIKKWCILAKATKTKVIKQ